jgi:hypothetical protein
MGKGNFSDDFKRDAMAQITDICFLPCPHPCQDNDALGAWQAGNSFKTRWDLGIK